MCNAATKIHQTDKEGRRANISQDGVRSQPLGGKLSTLLHRYFLETGK